MGEHRIQDGYAACAGCTSGSWYGGVLTIEDRDEAFLAIPEGASSFEDRAAQCRTWWDAVRGLPRRVVLVTPGADEPNRTVVGEAGYIEGPVCPKERTESPLLVWIERAGPQWRLRLHQDSQARVVVSSGEAIRCPSVAMTEAGLVLAFERDVGPFETKVAVTDAGGRTIASTPGRLPRLCAAPSGFVVATERATRDAVRLNLEYIVDGSVRAATELHEGDYLFNADLAWSPKDRAVVVAAESSPRFGYSNQIGSCRTIHTWKWAPDAEPVAFGMLPVERRAFLSFIAPENLSPIKPHVVIEDDGPTVAFKEHRYFTKKTFGWDLFVCRRSAGAWDPPVRVSPSLTTSDSPFGLVVIEGRYVGLFPAHENKGGPTRCFDHRVEVLRFDRTHRLDRYEVPDDKKNAFVMPVSYANISPPPADLKNPYPGRQLIWGDLHIHSIYSKCVAAVDGDPEENIRYVRDVLGCRVFAVAEHTQIAPGREGAWRLDRIEGVVGRDNVLLYASEPGMRAMRHTNWYTRDRETFEKLERVFIAHDRNYHDILRQLREDLPYDSVFMMRHFHGDAIPDEQILQHFDPHFEVAMEAMQGRCNAMLEAREGATKFPNQFLDAGCKIGLVGGTDHFRICPNHFCLTGFWVKEVSAAGVWEAIRNRYTIAMSDSRVAMKTGCKGVPMGREVTLAEDEDFRVSVDAACARPILRAGLMRDGVLLPMVEIHAKDVSIELTDPSPAPGRHWYVPTLEVATAYEEGHTGICHASPYFVYKRG